MERKSIISILVGREGYNTNAAIVAAHEAKTLSIDLIPLFEAWLQDASNKQDYTAEGISLLDMQNKTKSTYLAALLNMDWIIKEPEKAIPAINSTISCKL